MSPKEPLPWLLLRSVGVQPIFAILGGRGWCPEFLAAAVLATRVKVQVVLVVLVWHAVECTSLCNQPNRGKVCACTLHRTSNSTFYRLQGTDMLCRAVTCTSRNEHQGKKSTLRSGLDLHPACSQHPLLRCSGPYRVPMDLHLLG
jgi:hypothetical protein